MSKLTGKVAVVTGASKGIGAGIAKALAAEGASVVVNYASSKEGADKIVDEISKAGGQAVAVGGDVSKAAEAQGIIAAAVQHFGKLDILVNNSGVYAFSPIEEFKEEDFHRQFNINVLGLLLVTQAAVKHMGEGGSIINIGSLIARQQMPGGAVYAGTKAAVDGRHRHAGQGTREPEDPRELPESRRGGDGRHRRLHEGRVRHGKRDDRPDAAGAHRPAGRHCHRGRVPGIG